MLIKDKAFFFFSYEKPHQITPTDPVRDGSDGA